MLVAVSGQWQSNMHTYKPLFVLVSTRYHSPPPPQGIRWRSERRSLSIFFPLVMLPFASFVKNFLDQWKFVFGKIVFCSRVDICVQIFVFTISLIDVQSCFKQGILWLVNISSTLQCRIFSFKMSFNCIQYLMWHITFVIPLHYSYHHAITVVVTNERDGHLLTALQSYSPGFLYRYHCLDHGPLWSYILNYYRVLQEYRTVQKRCVSVGLYYIFTLKY